MICPHDKRKETDTSALRVLLTKPRAFTYPLTGTTQGYLAPLANGIPDFGNAVPLTVVLTDAATGEIAVTGWEAVTLDPAAHRHIYALEIELLDGAVRETFPDGRDHDYFYIEIIRDLGDQ